MTGQSPSMPRRRALAVALISCERLAAVAAALAVVFRIAGVLLSDRWHWSQYLAWIPGWLLLLTAAGATATWSIIRHFRRRPLRFGRIEVLSWATCATFVLYSTLVEWRWYRVLLPTRSDPNAVRVLAWNPAWAQMSAFHERVLEQEPDIAMFANPNQTAEWTSLRKGMGEKTYALRQGTLVVVSRFPIRHFGWTSLGIAPEPDRPSWWPVPKGSYRGGEALFMLVDAPGFENGLVVWFVDLPSDAWIARRRMFTEAAANIAAFRGPVLRRDDNGLDVPDNTLKWGQMPPGGWKGDEPVSGFPPPDLVVGDFNTPRGNRSAQLLAPDLTHAYDHAGMGPLGTFPRGLPILHIDQSLVARRVRVLDYDTADLGAARHTAQVIDIAPAK